MFGRKQPKEDTQGTEVKINEMETLLHPSKKEAAQHKQQATEAYRAKAIEFIATADTPFAIVAPRLQKATKDNIAVESSMVIALAGPVHDAAVLLTGIHDMRRQFLRKLAEDLDEQDMESLLELDEKLSKRGANDGRA